MVEASLPTSGATIMMVQLTKWLVFVVVALFYTSVVTAAPCRVSSGPTVSVDNRRDEVREVVDTSRDELEQLATAAGKQDHRPVLGMYTAATGYKADIRPISIAVWNKPVMICSAPYPPPFEFSSC
jgi:hypothetical protein